VVILGYSVTLSSGSSIPLPFSAAGLRLIVDDRLGGAQNMAVDAALLQSVDERAGPTLRLYGFSPACLSLGRFQPVADVNENALAAASVDLVRRPTGGKAVLHDHEVTYSMVLARRHLQPFTKRGAYQLCTDLLLGLLHVLGVTATAASNAVALPTVARQTTTATPSTDCFRTTAEFEIVAAGRKLVGSAQTTTRGGSLLHGSIPLNGSYRRIEGLLVPDPVASHGVAAELPPTSIEEAGGGCWSFAGARDALAGAAMASLGVEPEQLDASEKAVADQLAAERYAQEQWTRQV
jgi:lipoate-protein ligase A